MATFSNSSTGFSDIEGYSAIYIQISFSGIWRDFSMNILTSCCFSVSLWKLAWHLKGIITVKFFPFLIAWTIPFLSEGKGDFCLLREHYSCQGSLWNWKKQTKKSAWKAFSIQCLLRERQAKKQVLISLMWMSKIVCSLCFYFYVFLNPITKKEKENNWCLVFMLLSLL